MKKMLATMMIAGTLGTAVGMAAEVDRRFARQQGRIGQGITSGSLSTGETRRLERQEGAVHQEIHSERVLNGGHLTGAERAHVNRQQNRLSNEIYRLKHN